MTKTELSKLGEFAFVDRLTKDVKIKNSSTILGVGDDAALISNEEGKYSVLSSEIFSEGVDFDLVYTPLKHLGYKCVVASIADIYAMNGVPQQLTVSLAISARFCVEDIEELYSGIRLAGERYQVDIVGGDTSASVNGLVISITSLGVVNANEQVGRSGAKPTDLICCTGDLGAAYMGLSLLEREKSVFEGETGTFEPAFESNEYILERQLKPELNIEILEQLRKQGIKLTSLMDISDGLASELLHLCKSSKVGVRLYEDKLPIDYQTAKMAEELNLNVTTVALNGGDDYEFLFTLPLGLMDKAREIEGLRFIGHTTEEGLGANLVTRDGREIPIKAQGWL